MRITLCFLAILAMMPAWVIAQYTPHGLPIGVDPYSVALQQGPASAPSSTTQSGDSAQSGYDSGRSLARNTRSRASRAGNMFGDSLPAIGHVLFGSGGPQTYAPTGIAGGGRYSKIGENNKAFTMDRVYFTYQNFHNAAPVSLSGGPFVDYSISQYTVGGEKTLLDGLISVELRGSLLNDIDGFGTDTSFDNGTVSNLTANLKVQLYETDDLGVVAGLGVGLPTGSDFQGYISTGTNFTLDNQAVYLLPFVGATYAPLDSVFGTTFVQISTPTNGDHFLIDGIPTDNLNPQTTLHVSSSLGFWLIDEADNFPIQGIAWLNEAHYTTALQDPDVVGDSFGYINMASSTGRYNILNVTSGVHFQVNDGTSFRVAAVFPIRRAADRTFDGEVQATLNQQF